MALIQEISKFIERVFNQSATLLHPKEALMFIIMKNGMFALDITDKYRNSPIRIPPVFRPVVNVNHDLRFTQSDQSGRNS